MPHETPLRLLQLTDPHLFADEAGEIYGVRTAASLQAVLARAQSGPHTFDAVLATGDIAEDGRRATYERFRRQMVALGKPVLCLPGNHEDPEEMAALLGTPPLQYCGSADFGRWRVVMLDSHQPGQPGGRLTGAELARLDRELATAAGRHVLVCLHHQPIPMGSPWLDAVGLQDAGALLELCGRHGNVRALAWGHVHQASDRMHQGMRMLSTPSTCAQFTPDTERCVMDLRPPGYRWLELRPDGAIDSGVVWLDEWQPGARPPDTRQLA